MCQMMCFCISFLFVLTGCAATRDTPAPSNMSDKGFVNSDLLSRHYQAGESLSYQMIGINKSASTTKYYQAQTDGVVKTDTSGSHFEEFHWSHLSVDGAPVILSPASINYGQKLSLDPNYKMPFPPLNNVYAELVGPILDLMTFYTDEWITIRTGKIAHIGDHVYIKYGLPASWADGKNLLIAEDCIDFDIALSKLDDSIHEATVIVRHVPPAQTTIKLPTDWMRVPVKDTPNNWVQVSKNTDGTYTAAVGKEIYDVELKIDLGTGRIKYATMDNPVEVLERQCVDAGLTSCGGPLHYQIRRQIEIH